MSSEVAVAFEREFVEKQDAWAPVLPPSISPQRFKSVVLTAVNKNPSLLEADRTSLLVACSQAAQDGLLPDGREGAITAFWDKRSRKYLAQWMPMVAGILKRCREKGELSSISAYTVYADDEFELVLGDEPKIIHKPNLVKTREQKSIIAAYAIFKNGDEVVHREIMTRPEIEQTRHVSRAKDGGAWRDWYSEMCRKTVIRRGAKSIPLSSELSQIIERDDQWVDFNLPKEENPDENSNHLNAEFVEEESTSAECEELVKWIENCRNIDALNEFSTKHKEKLDSLREDDKQKVRVAYYEQQKAMRKS